MEVWLFKADHIINIDPNLDIEDGISLTRIPVPTGLARKLLDAANGVFPTAIAHNREVNVHT